MNLVSPPSVPEKNIRGMGQYPALQGRTSSPFETGHSVKVAIFHLGAIAAGTGQFTPRVMAFLFIRIGGVSLLCIFTSVLCD